MDTLFVAAFLAISALAILQAVLILLQTWEHHRFTRGRLNMLHQFHDVGRVAVIVPCKGRDVGLERNLVTLFRQDYENYELRFVVEGADDPAYPIIERLIARFPGVEARIVFAGRATDSGQKVHNLRVATAGLGPRIRCLAFVDSDARLRRQWLRALVSRIDQEGVGAATGYRWYIPVRKSLANHLLYSLNSTLAIFLGSHPPTVIWGGSWAILREKFERLAIREAWKGTLSDDLVASRVIGQARLRVLFEPACMVVSPADMNLRELFWFVRRQYLITRFHFPFWSGAIFVLLTMATWTFFASFAIAVGALVARNDFAWTAGGICLILYGLGALGGLLRQDLAMTYFPRLRRTLREARRFEVWMGPLVALVNWLGLLASLVGRQITWRGIIYRMGKGGVVQRIERLELPPPNRPVDEDRDFHLSPSENAGIQPPHWGKFPIAAGLPKNPR